MKNLLLVLLISLLAYSSKSQALEQPSEGKTMIYFIRPSATGFLIKFKYFDGDKFVGIFNGAGYITYECEPGNHVFWAGAENRSFITSELLPDHIYFVEARVQMGAIKAGVKLLPIPSSDTKRLAKMMKAVGKLSNKNLSDADYERIKPEFDFYVTKGIERYNQRLMNSSNFLTIKPDSFVQ